MTNFILGAASTIGLIAIFGGGVLLGFKIGRMPKPDNKPKE